MADLLTEVGHASFTGDDWKAQFAAALGVRGDTLRHMLSGRFVVGADHGVLDDALALAKRRENEIRRARAALERYVKKHRTART